MIPMLLIMALPPAGLALFFVLPLRHSLPAYVAAVAISPLFYHRLMQGSYRQPVATGRRGMIGLIAEVRAPHEKTGTVRCRGESWNARPQATNDRPRVVPL